MDDLDRRIVRAIQDGLPIVEEPFAAAARGLGISVDELLARLRAMLERGEVRRFGASVAHRSAGFDWNVMCVWRVPAESVEAFAREAVQLGSVTHCYERPGLPGWPYNVYTMIHGRTEGDSQAVIDGVCRATGQTDYVALLSTREFKKTWTRL
jgi:DNA-binding Lrp family transcriptional regulator